MSVQHQYSFIISPLNCFYLLLVVKECLNIEAAWKWKGKIMCDFL